MEDSTSKLTLQLDLARSRIRVHRKTLAALGNPEYILLIVNPEEKTLGIIETPNTPGAHRIKYGGGKQCQELYACLDKALVPAVTDLLRLKMETPEIGLGPRIDAINDYLDASIEEIDQLIQAIPSDGMVTWDELNRLFLKTVGLVS